MGKIHKEITSAWDPDPGLCVSLRLIIEHGLFVIVDMILFMQYFIHQNHFNSVADP
jgi:hypothetical protein